MKNANPKEETKVKSPIEAIKAAAARMDTGLVEQAIRTIGGSMHVSTDQRLVRAALIEIIAERSGEDRADTIMDELGM